MWRLLQAHPFRNLFITITPFQDFLCGVYYRQDIQRQKNPPEQAEPGQGENESLNNFRSCISHRCYCNGMNLPQFIL